MIGTRIIADESTPVDFQVRDLDLSAVRCVYSDLSDRCMEIVLSRRMDLDDVLLERYAVVCAPGEGESSSIAIIEPSLSSESSWATQIRTCRDNAGTKSDAGQYHTTRLGVRILVETGAPI